MRWSLWNKTKLLGDVTLEAKKDISLLGTLALISYIFCLSKLSCRPDRVVLSFTLAIKDLHASYAWRRRSMRGEVGTKVQKRFLPQNLFLKTIYIGNALSLQVSASIGRAFLSVKLRQKVSNSKWNRRCGWILGESGWNKAWSIGLLTWKHHKAESNAQCQLDLMIFWPISGWFTGSWAVQLGGQKDCSQPDHS